MQTGWTSQRQSRKEGRPRDFNRMHKSKTVKWRNVVQDPYGEAGLYVRYGWFPSDIVDLDLLDCPAVDMEFPRQVFWQRDACEDGVCHVSGSASAD